MLEAKAIKEIKKNGKVTGYRLKDTSGHEMDVESKKIVIAMSVQNI